MAPTIVEVAATALHSASGTWIAIDDLRRQPVEFDRKFSPAELAPLPSDLAPQGEVGLSGMARLAGDGMRLEGRLRGEVFPLCARCLEAAPLVLDHGFDLLYQPESLLEEGADVALSAADADLGFFEGAGVQLEDLAREQMLLALPMQALCRPECRGLCPRCGANRNRGECGCAALPSAQE